MKKLIAIFVLLAGGAGTAYWYFNYGKPKEKPQIMTSPITRQDIVEVVQATGALEAQRLVQVGSQVSGTVKELYADFNDIVTENQKIAELDDSLLQVQVDIQNAAIQRQESDIAQQRVQLLNDEKNLERAEKQSAAGLIAVQALESAQLQVKTRKAQILSAEKGLTSSRASLAQAELNVRYCTIYAPVTGVVVERRVDKGQTVQSSVNVAQFFTIATDITMLKLTAGVDEADIGKVRRGMPVTFTVESYGAQQFQGTVGAVRLNATTTNNVVTYPVWIDVPNNDLKLRPSMTATIRIIISTAESVLRIPNAALRFKPNRDIYAALEIPEPAAGAGRVNAREGGPNRGEGGQGANAQAGAGGAQPPAAGASGAQPTTPQPGVQAGNQPGGGGRGGDRTQQAGGGRGGAQGDRQQRGFGRGGNMNMTPEMLARMQQSGGGRSGAGRTGGGGGGRGGRTQTPANASGNTTPLGERNAEKIDDLFQEPPRQSQPGTVYTWDEAKRELKSHNIRYGVTDGQWSEYISGGDLQAGQAVVTTIILPLASRPGQMPGQTNPFMGGQQNRGGMGGMMPGGGGPGGGGGGGGRGGGGGGGGRGGN